MRYAAYGHTLESAFLLPELSETDGTRCDFAIGGGSMDPCPPATPALSPLSPRRRPWLQVEASPLGRLLKFGRTASFEVRGDGATILVHAGHGAGRGLNDTVRHLLLDQVLPLAISHNGALVLHGSAAIVEGQAVACVGPGGAGKSTLTASLARAGGAVLADDALVVDEAEGRVTVQSSYPGLRLWPDAAAFVDGGAAPAVAAYTDKRRLGRADGLSFLAGGARLARIYVIQPRATRHPRVDVLSKRDAAMAVLTHSYVLDASDAGRLAGQLSAACRVIGAVPVRALRYPRQFDRLAEVRDAIRRDLRA